MMTQGCLHVLREVSGLRVITQNIRHKNLRSEGQRKSEMQLCLTKSVFSLYFEAVVFELVENGDAFVDTRARAKVRTRPTSPQSPRLSQRLARCDDVALT